MKMYGKGIRLAVLAVVSALIATAGVNRVSAASGKMTITAIDLGADNTGEATMITAGDGGALLVDSGDTHTRTIFNWLDANGYKNKKFNTLVTHWHDDHAGNTEKIIRNYNVEKVYIPSYSYLEEIYHPYYRYERQYAIRILKAAKECGTKVVYLKKGMKIKVGSGVSGKVLYLNGSPRKENDRNVDHINNQSATIMFTGGGCKYLNAGDIQVEAENRLLKSGVSLKADIFKLSHHGYDTSNQMKFLKAVDPTYAYFTGHESDPKCYLAPRVKASVTRMSKISNVFGTRYNGTIKFVCSGGNVKTSVARNKYVMYQKLTSKSTGKTVTKSFVFNDKCYVRHFDRLVDTDKYYNQQVTSRGKMFMGDLVRISKRWYLRNSSGMMAYNTIAADMNKKYYYFDSKGRRFENGWKKVNKKKYYFTPARVKGWKKISGKTYYFMDEKYAGYRKSQEGILLNGFKKISGKRYYFIDGRYKGYKSAMFGAMATGWATISDSVYYMDKNGVIQTGLVKVGTDLYYFGTDGKRMTGWRTVAGKKYYFQTNGKALKSKDATISGHRYRFDANGVMIKEINCHLDSNGNPIVGWHDIDGKRYYGYSDGELATGKVVIDGVEYEFDTVANGCALLTAVDSSGAAAWDTSAEAAPEEEPGSSDAEESDEYGTSSAAEEADEQEPEQDEDEGSEQDPAADPVAEESGEGTGSEEPAADEGSEDPGTGSGSEEPETGTEEPEASEESSEDASEDSTESAPQSEEVIAETVQYEPAAASEDQP